MKRIFTLIIMLGAMLFMAINSESVYACNDYPIGNPLPPYIVCQIMDEESYVDVLADPGTDQYVISSSSVVEVDGSFLLAYHNESSSTTSLNSAVQIWNNLDIISIEESNTVYSLLITESNLGNNGKIATYILQDGVDTITINSYYFDSLTSLEQTRVLMHELGHALGLDDVYGISSSIMAQGVSEVLLINSQDIALLRGLFPTIE